MTTGQAPVRMDEEPLTTSLEQVSLPNDDVTIERRKPHIEPIEDEI